MSKKAALRIHTRAGDAVKKATCNDLLSLFCSMSHEIYINLITHLLADARASPMAKIDIKLMFARKELRVLSELSSIFVDKFCDKH